MAIIVDKKQKRKDIALSCKNLFLQKGIKNLTISLLAKEAGVGKGTLYDYFKNKEDIVFEIVNILTQEHDVIKQEKIEKADSIKNKIKVFFSFFYDKEDDDLRQLYKEFVSISLIDPNEEMIEYQTCCFENYYAWLEDIIEDGIKKCEIKPIARKLSKGLFVLGEGVFIASSTTNTIKDVKKEIDDYVDALFELIEEK